MEWLIVGGLVFLAFAISRKQQQPVMNQVPIQAPIRGTVPQSGAVIQPAVAAQTQQSPMPLPPIFQQPNQPIVTIENTSQPLVVQAPTNVYGNGTSVPFSTVPQTDFYGIPQTIPDVIGPFSFSPGTSDSTKLLVFQQNGYTLDTSGSLVRSLIPAQPIDYGSPAQGTSGGFMTPAPGSVIGSGQGATNISGGGGGSITPGGDFLTAKLSSDGAVTWADLNGNPASIG